MPESLYFKTGHSAPPISTSSRARRISDDRRGAPQHLVDDPAGVLELRHVLERRGPVAQHGVGLGDDLAQPGRGLVELAVRLERQLSELREEQRAAGDGHHEGLHHPVELEPLTVVPRVAQFGGERRDHVLRAGRDPGAQLQRELGCRDQVHR
ncbi:hypothetical protein ACFOWZ_36520 [Lentzea rhizosphaerae]|uniref:Uncharacterized protein n=1 Tax=Lentzea rhizosphaerae TaxID=2041025 RepID=A0ABV8C590_9PSEU